MVEPPGGFEFSSRSRPLGRFRRAVVEGNEAFSIHSGNAAGRWIYTKADGPASGFSGVSHEVGSPLQQHDRSAHDRLVRRLVHERRPLPPRPPRRRPAAGVPAEAASRCLGDPHPGRASRPDALSQLLVTAHDPRPQAGPSSTILGCRCGVSPPRRGPCESSATTTTAREANTRVATEVSLLRRRGF